MLRPNPDLKAVLVPATPALTPHVTASRDRRGGGEKEREVENHGGLVGLPAPEVVNRLL